MKISDILWEAANNHLWDGVEPTPSLTTTFSCDTVHNICDIHGDPGDHLRCRDFFMELGLNPSSLSAFDEFQEGEEQQGARYLWLMFAYTYAKEQGL